MDGTSGAVGAAGGTLAPVNRTLEALENLMIDYLAQSTMVGAVEELTAASPERIQELFGPLARNLRIPPEHIAAYWAGMSASRQQGLWLKTLHQRIETTAAHKAFRDATTERVASKALNKIENMLTAGLIRNAGELIAIAKMAGPAPVVGGGGVTLNLGTSGLHLQAGQTLPGGDEVMTIQLHPRTAKTLSEPEIRSPTRVIDAEMVGVKDLRNLGNETLEPNGGDTDE